MLDRELPLGGEEYPGQAEDFMSTDPSPGWAFITHDYQIRQRRELAVVISESELERLIERLKGCKPRGWSDAWLTGTGIGAGISTAALVTVLTLPSNLHSNTKIIMWMLVILGGVIFGLCLCAYSGQRHKQAEGIDELGKDLEMRRRSASHSPRASAPPSE